LRFTAHLVKQKFYKRGIVTVMATLIGFRPTETDEKILRSATRDGETTADVIRRALRALENQQWLDTARADAERLADENLHNEPDAW
jgi:antitoxin ParD1/3/4